MLILFSILLLLGSSSPSRSLSAAPAQTVSSILSFGAKGDGQTLSTAAIQSAIDQVSSHGGGVVLVPPGDYLSGTIRLRDDVTLRVQQGATLHGSLNPDDYPLSDPFVSGSGDRLGQALILAVDANHVGIEGAGTIDGSHANAKGVRPFLLRFDRCRNVSVSGVTLQKAGSWASHYKDCEEVVVKDVTISNHGNANNDGIDIDACRHVTLTGCDISSGDDAICLKTTIPKPCRDITIRHCRISSDWAAIKFGTESCGPFQDVTITDCFLHDTSGGGIKIFSVDGAEIRNIALSHLTMENVDMPIFLRLGARLKTFQAGQKPQPIGVMEKISIRHIRATHPHRPQVNPPTAIFMTGIPGHPVQDIVLEDIVLETPGGGTLADAGRIVPEAEAAYPEYARFGVLPAYGIFLRHAKSVTLHQVQIKPAASDLRPLQVLDDVQGISP